MYASVSLFNHVNGFVVVMARVPSSDIKMQQHAHPMKNAGTRSILEINMPITHVTMLRKTPSQSSFLKSTTGPKRHQVST